MLALLALLPKLISDIMPALIGLVVTIFLLAGVFFIGHHEGTIACQIAQKEAQDKEDQRLKEAYGNIQKNIPVNRAAAIRRLQSHAGR